MIRAGLGPHRNCDQPLAWLADRLARQDSRGHELREPGMEEMIDIAALRSSVADVLAKECDLEAVVRHTAHNTGPLMPLWATASALGWMALAIPEQHGGLGLDVDALVPVYEELGRRAAPLPYLTTMLAADCIGRMAPPDRQAEWLPRIAAGDIATLSAPLPVTPACLTLRKQGDHIVLAGEAPDLVDARDAAMILVTAIDEAGVTWRVLIESGDGAQIDTRTLWDHGHTISTLVADNLHLPASRAFSCRAEDEDALLTHAALGLAAEAIGGSEGILASTIAYLGMREQFGKPIGSFQALKHRVADHHTRTVAGRALLEAATAMAVSGAAGANSEASSAKALACADYGEVARDCIQLHGGMGFTVEQGCDLYFKRAYFNAQLFGDRALHLVRATTHLVGHGASR